MVVIFIAASEAYVQFVSFQFYTAIWRFHIALSG